MAEWRRYAVYHLPPPGALADFAAAWLGWDVAAGRAVAHPRIEGLPAPIVAITATPRRYGFHGTLKPPFRANADAAEIAAALDLAAAGIAPFDAPPLRLSRIGSFLALTPAAPSAALSDLAFSLVEGLDGFRAPPGEDEIARRHAAGLSPAQEAMLLRWGYPYVGPEFRFHLTLTGALPAEGLAAVEAALAPRLAPLLEAETPIREVALCGEDGAGRFHLIRRVALAR